MVKEIVTEKLEAALLAHTVRLVDVRSADERQRDQIPNSEHVPLYLIPLKMHEYDKKETVVFYCATGARSSQACRYFQSRGHEHVFNLTGGMGAWAKKRSALAP